MLLGMISMKLLSLKLLKFQGSNCEVQLAKDSFVIPVSTFAAFVQSPVASVNPLCQSFGTWAMPANYPPTRSSSSRDRLEAMPTAWRGYVNRRPCQCQTHALHLASNCAKVLAMDGGPGIPAFPLRKHRVQMNKKE